jgi:MFS family permease
MISHSMRVVTDALDTPPPPGPSKDRQATISPLKAWTAVLICTVAYMFAYVDRQILSLLIEPVKADLALSDTQFGLLNGLAFALFYAVMGVPIAALSDSRRRSTIIAAGLFVWSVATMVCGLARSFTQLFLARICVGAGEACMSPAAYSLIADLFPKDKLGRALAVYSTGSFLGAGLGFLASGWIIGAVGRGAMFALPGLAHLKAWQLAFMLAGAPGVLLALIVVLFVKEPARVQAAAAPTFAQVLSFMRGCGAVYPCIFVGYSFAAMALFSLMSWSPAYLMRTFHLDAHASGYWLGLAIVLGCTGGVLVSGALVDGLRRRGHLVSPFTVGILGAVGVVACLIGLPWVGSFGLALTLLVGGFFFAAFALPPSTTAMQLTAPPPMRARISAMFLFCNSLLGLALGAYLVGLLNDRVFHATGQSLVTVVVGAALLQIVILAVGTPALHRQLSRA